MATLTIVIVGAGSVTSSDPIISCPGVCGPVALNTAFPIGGPWTFELTAIPDPGFSLLNFQVTVGNPFIIFPDTSTVSPQIFEFSNPDFDYEITATFVACPTISLTNNPLPCYTPEVSYNEQLIVIGGTAPYTFTPMFGPCGPPLNTVGLSMDAAGLVTGIPISGATVEQNFRVSDANGCFLDFCVSISQCQTPCPPLTLENSGPFAIFLNELITPIQLVAQGGLAPYTYQVDPNWNECPGGPCVNATLPPGLSLGLSTGIISGTATSGSPCSYVPILITDANQCQTRVCIQIVSSERPIQCYELTHCPSEVDPAPIIVTNNLSQYVAPNTVIQILGQCFTVQIAQSCIGAVTLNNPVITVFTDCCNCNPPKCYELTDCTLQTPQIITDTDLSQYVGQTIKVCNFNSTEGLPIVPTTLVCTGSTQGFVTQVTGSTSGFYFDGLIVVPYTNPITIPLVLGQGICVNPLSPFDVISAGNPVIYTVQYFLGAVPLTNPVTISPDMTLAAAQFFINQQIVYPNTIITVTAFTALTGLVVDVNIQSPVVDQLISILTQPSIQAPPIVVTSNFFGSCICYTVIALPPNCNCLGTPFSGIISGYFADCTCCDPPPVPDPDPYEPTIPEIDKHTYKVCESECDINNNKTFANAMYDIFKTDAYGIESCCPRNFNQIWIAKELSDFNKIKC